MYIYIYNNNTITRYIYDDVYSVYVYFSREFFRNIRFSAGSLASSVVTLITSGGLSESRQPRELQGQRTTNVSPRT